MSSLHFAIFSSVVVCVTGLNCLQWSIWFPAPSRSAPARIVSQIILASLSRFRQSPLTKEAWSKKLYDLCNHEGACSAYNLFCTNSSTTRNQLQTTVVLNGGKSLAFSAAKGHSHPALRGGKEQRLLLILMYIYVERVAPVGKGDSPVAEKGGTWT